ncbi:MAG: YggS family pyridoxal phosphate-dependent enzyme [Candidatus Amulumruptor caecigallinarius]|nr:YggS family pyridoxal phosphate-dependent enzyme [Candidatus Amulumruptor caecigallinarius]MCM1395900.1 YggS family pyridoxal phosphate-dependent enzyme [Candidatus Amulumruptor caecigallinarius]MCM1452935.1 YggS family pyridoxal phosphate-dependent enzyme [bacterium]
MSITTSLHHITATLPEGVELVAVSKFHPVEALSEAYDAGQRAFGESRVQELVAKAPQLPGDIRWHFIGHLQSNKVRQLLTVDIDTVQSVDSIKLLRLLDAEALRAGKRINALMQVHVAREETKFGFTPEELLAELTPEVVGGLQAVTITGVMGMASNTDDAVRVEADFAAIAATQAALAKGVMQGHPEFRQISMGMSHDYPLALRHGATMVRVGTDIFGNREY